MKEEMECYKTKSLTGNNLEEIHKK